MPINYLGQWHTSVTIQFQNQDIYEKKKYTIPEDMEDLNEVSRVWRSQIRMYLAELPYCLILSWQGGILSRGRGTWRRELLAADQSR